MNNLCLGGLRGGGGGGEDVNRIKIELERKKLSQGLDGNDREIQTCSSN